MKVGDFGSSQEFYEEQDTIMPHKGTLYFLAPECIKPSKSTSFYSGRAADMWALGMTFFNMIFNDFPFSIEPGVDVRYEIQTVNFGKWCPDATIPFTESLKIE